MLKLIRFFKPYMVLVLSIILLLFIQAMCDLALPNYMADIVDTGVANNGIESPVPDVIRQSEWDRDMLFMTDDDKEKSRKIL